MWIRNRIFDANILESKSLSLPVIAVGNLSMGGTGKSPHVEYLVRLLKEDFNVAILSRGYKRKTSGFVLADDQTTVRDIGDEPFQFRSKFQDIKVAVDEKRLRGIKKLQESVPDLDLILLDDAYQHRYVKPGLSILLSDFHNLYSNDYVVPSGTLREFGSGADRADMIVVTKSPKVLSPITRDRIRKELKPQPQQKLYFSYIEHGAFLPVPGIDFVPDKKRNYYAILLFAGIANYYPLEFYLKDYCVELEILKFPDHHRYRKKDIMHILDTFDSMFSQNKLMVTTEKDAVRLRDPEINKMLKFYPVCYVPIKINFHKNDKVRFNNQILQYVKENSRDK
jgi:tetraacyldisaccharide 4'-kinase